MKYFVTPNAFGIQGETESVQDKVKYIKSWSKTIERGMR